MGIRMGPIKLLQLPVGASQSLALGADLHIIFSLIARRTSRAKAALAAMVCEEEALRAIAAVATKEEEVKAAEVVLLAAVPNLATAVIHHPKIS